jgi:dihydrolipoamide dehydrogenase
VIVATGSKARHLPGIPVDNDMVCDNEGALAFRGAEAPRRHRRRRDRPRAGERLAAAGVEVTILEALPNFLGAADEAVQKEAWKVFTKTQGLDIRNGGQNRQGTVKKAGVTVEYADDKGAAQKLECDRLIVSIGRGPQHRRAERCGRRPQGGCARLHRGRWPLPHQSSNVYAIGDVVRGPMLAHKAEDEGVMVAETIAGQKPHIDYNTIPGSSTPRPKSRGSARPSSNARRTASR